MGKSLVLSVLDKPKKLSKFSLLTFTLVAMPFFVLLLSSHVSAQVIIKEKVEINPQSNVLPEYPQSYLDPCLNISRPPYYQSVYSCSGYPVEPYQQMFPWQSGGYLGQLDSATIYNVEIISGTDNAYFYKVGYWDTLSSVQVDPEYIGSSLTGLTGVELAGWGEYRVYQGIGVWEREHFALYNIRFDNYDLQTAYVTVRITNTSTNELTDWHTTIVNPQYTMQNPGIDGDTVLHNRSITITPNIRNSLALTCNQFGYGSCPPTNVTFNIEIIQGQEYGNIGKYNDFFGSFEYAPAYTGLSYDEFRYGFYVFEANGLQPDTTAVVRIRQSSSDTDIGSFEYTLNIKRNFLPPVSENGSIVVETNKNTAMPGDTLDIMLKWEDGSNGIVDFSDWQEFGVWLADGFGYGTLLDPVTGDTSDAFEVTGKELKLIVHQDVTDANKKIVIAAETEVAVLGGNRMMQNNPQLKMETKSIDKKIISNFRTVEQGGFVKANNKIDKSDAVDKEDDDGEINIDFIIGSQYLSGIKEIRVNPFIVEIDPPTVSAGDTAKIIPKYMDSTGNYVEFDSLQTFELGMIDGCVLGKLSNAGIDTNYFYGVTQPFYFIADSSADSGSVNIRVGIIETNQQNRSLTNNNQPQPDNPVTFCFLNSYQTELYVDKSVVVENECDYPPYDPNLYELNYELIRHDNYYPWVFDDDAQFPITTLIDVCDLADEKQTGGSKPVFYSRIRKNQFGSYVNSWDIQPLIDGEDKLHFTIVEPTTKENTSLKFDFVTGVCYNKINPPSQEPKVLIYNLADISNTKIIPNKDQALQAMEDFCGHHCYPQETFRYKLIDIINLHEGEHMNDYRDSCLIPKFQNLEDDIKNVTLGCNSYNEENKKKQIALIKYLIKEFIRDAIKHFEQVNILATKNDYTYEKKLQRRPSIVNRITDYIDRLKSEFNISVPANCKTCR